MGACVSNKSKQETKQNNNTSTTYETPKYNTPTTYETSKYNTVSYDTYNRELCLVCNRNSDHCRCGTDLTDNSRNFNY